MLQAGIDVEDRGLFGEGDHLRFEFLGEVIVVDGAVGGDVGDVFPGHPLLRVDLIGKRPSLAS